MEIWITIITAIAAIVGTATVIFIGLRSKQIYRPVLEFNMGFSPYKSSLSKSLKKNIKKESISSLIYGANLPKNSYVMFVCPYLLKNNSKLPIKNLRVHLEYASKYLVENETVFKGLENALVLNLRPQAYSNRVVQNFGDRVHVYYTIPILRWGEPAVVADIIQMTNYHQIKELENKNNFTEVGLVKKLKEVKALCDCCIVDLFIYSENIPPLSKRIKILWLDTNSTTELKSATEDVTKIFWGGKFPKPGLYWRPWPIVRKELLVKEYGEAIIPKLEVVESSKDINLYLENPIKSERNLFILTVPPWNYYQVSDNLEDTDNLIKKSGFTKLR